MNHSKFSGIYTALITPFAASGEVDWEAFRKLLKIQVNAKVSGVVVSGTTGESPTLKTDEKKKLILLALEELKGAHRTGLHVIAGTCSNHTANSVELSRWAAQQGVDGILAVAPYYNKPSPAGLDAHFNAIADSVLDTEHCEVMLYNVPGRTGYSIPTELVIKLAQHPRIRSIKEASGQVSLTSDLLDLARASKVSLKVFSGDDPTFLAQLALGGAGNVSVASNVIPAELVALEKAFRKGEIELAETMHRRFYPVFCDLFIESNPGPVKWLLGEWGLCEKIWRLPLVGPTPASEAILKTTLKRCGVNRP